MALEVFSRQAPAILKLWYAKDEVDTFTRNMRFLQQYDGALEWAQERINDLGNSYAVARSFERVGQEFQSAQDDIESNARKNLEAEEQRKKVEQEALETNQKFRESSQQLNIQLGQAQDRLRNASLVGFTHPFTKLVSKKATQCIAFCGKHIASWRQWGIDRLGGGIWGRRVVDLGLPVLGTAVFQKAALAQSCSSLSLIGAAQCASTVATPYFWIPAAAVYGVSWFCATVYKKAKQMFTYQVEVDHLDTQIQRERAAHEQQEAVFAQQKQKLGEEIQGNNEAILSAQERSKRFQRAKLEIEGALGNILVKNLAAGTTRAFKEVRRIEAQNLSDAEKSVQMAPHLMTAIEHGICTQVITPKMLEAVQSASSLAGIKLDSQDDDKEGRFAAKLTAENENNNVDSGRPNGVFRADGQPVALADDLRDD